MDKKLAFDYFIYSLIEFYKKHLSMSENEAMSQIDRLRAMKLLFFVCAKDSKKDDPGLLATFNKFCAMPFGHVESDIYTAIGDDQLSSYTIKIETTKKRDSDFDSFDAMLKSQIDSAICALLSENSHLLTDSSFSLVDLSHEWYSWKSTYQMARSINRSSLPIGNKVIQIEPKFYKLN
jgi:uncharacterized phage-associated protein